MSISTIKRALISVSDKTGIVEFAQKLHAAGIEILSTGGTAELLQNYLPVIEVSDYTGFPEMMAGRVKTLHPKIHGGLLGRRGIDDDIMAAHGIKPIDLLIVNLYPFQKVTADPECALATAIENIDIGGPTLLRAAAKNYQAVTVVIDAKDYHKILSELQEYQGISMETRFELAKKVFAFTAQYDAAIANYLGKSTANKFPDQLVLPLLKKQTLRYGENPHQDAAFYLDSSITEASIATAQQWQGKELSFNNIVDSDAALACVKCFIDKPACVIVKHANPCGVATGDSLEAAYQRAFATDPTSAFGGIIAVNQVLNATTMQTILQQQFVEVIIAPTIEPAALTLVKTKPNVRVLSCGEWPAQPKPRFDFKQVTGGMLVQDSDLTALNLAALQVVTARVPTADEMQDLLFAWTVAKFVKSNAIVYAKNNATIGIGAGQMSRVDSARIAGIKAANQNLSVAGAVMASDAFFPFRDGIDTAAAAGITAIIQPGGSMRDQEVIMAANEANIAMVFTRIRHFRH